MTEKARTMSKYFGMGAIPTSESVIFRVWAPHAEAADGLPCSVEISIGPYTVVMFSQDT